MDFGYPNILTPPPTLQQMTLSIEAFHGTSLQAAEEIQETSYRESDSNAEWLGRGVYFFVDGVSDPLADAIEWAKAQAWNTKTQSVDYEEFAVLKSVVEIDEGRLIDLTTDHGIRNFNILKSRFLHRIYGGRTKKELIAMSSAEHNCELFNYMAATVRSHAIKHNLYIKNVAERKLHLKLNVPNSTVLCVRKANFKFNAELVHKGVIE